MNAPRSALQPQLMVTVAHEQGKIILHQDGAPPLRHLPSNGSDDAQAAHGVPQRR